MKTLIIGLSLLCIPLVNGVVDDYYYYWNGTSLLFEENMYSVGVSGTVTLNYLGGGGAYFLQSSNPQLLNTTPITFVNNTRNWTVSIWVRGNNWSGTDNLVSIVWNSTDHMNIQALSGGANIRASVRSGAGWKSSASYDTALGNLVWHHIVATYNGSNISIYVNGTKRTGVASGYAEGGTGLSLGSSITGSYDHSGELDDLIIYNRTLSDSEVTSLWTYGRNYVFNVATGNNSCVYTSGNWLINGSDNCHINQDVQINTGYNISVVGIGNLTICANVTNWLKYIQDWTTQLNFCNSGKLGGWK